MQKDVNHTYAAFVQAVDFNFTSQQDYESRIPIFNETLKQIAEVNAANLTYFVRS